MWKQHKLTNITKCKLFYNTWFGYFVYIAYFSHSQVMSWFNCLSTSTALTNFRMLSRMKHWELEQWKLHVERLKLTDKFSFS